mgnify:CR=1 FL=1
MLLSHFSVTLRLSYQEQNEQMNPETNIPAFTDEMAAPFAELVSKSQKVVLTCHVNADGDALGSTLGFRKALINMGKEASVITPDLAPSAYAWMKGYKTLCCYERQQEQADALLDEADLIVMMDYNDLGRVKALGEKVSLLRKPTMLIDHHLDPVVKADVMISRPRASATCQIIFNLLLAAGYSEYIDSDVLTDMYAGIVTDTGALSYNSNDPALYILVAEMLRRGVDKVYVHDKIFNNKSVKQLKLQGFTLGRKFHRVEKMPIAIMSLSQKELEQFNYNTGDTEGFVNIPLQVRDIIVSCLALERPDCVKMSFRSKGDFPVNEYAAKYFGGGGHLNAAGGSFAGSVDDAVKLYRESIVDFYVRWMKRTAK